MMSLFNKKKRKEKRFDDKLLWYQPWCYFPITAIPVMFYSIIKKINHF